MKKKIKEKVLEEFDRRKALMTPNMIINYTIQETAKQIFDDIEKSDILSARNPKRQYYIDRDWLKLKKKWLK